VQLWKGWCQRTGGGNDKAGGSFPGGVGAEVCVYQYGLAKYGGGLYPYLKKPFRLKFQLQPPGGDPGIFFTASTKADSYWLGCWMTHNDYKDKYKPKHPNHPVDPARYILKYWIDGAPQPDWV
jgi:hypothetical protein